MTGVRFDQETGRLRFGRADFDALVAAATDQDGDGARVAALRDAGVLRDGGEPHPRVAVSLLAVVAPVCRLVLRTRDDRGHEEEHAGWVAGEAATLLLDAGGGDRELVAVHPTFVPEAIARVVGLGPRPANDGAVPFTAAPAELDGPVGGAPVLLRWEAVASWEPTAGSPGRRALHVLDTPAGTWVVEPVGERLVVSPASPAVVWRLLTRLLPVDAELAGIGR